MTESEEELKSLLMKVKEENEKAGWNSTLKKQRSWHLVPSLHAKKMEKEWQTFLGSQIIADCDCSHEIKRCLLLGRKTVTNLDSILKSKRHHFANKGPYSQSYGFSRSHVWMWELDHKKVQCQRIDAFKLCWRRLLRVPWTARRSSQSILKEVNPEYSLERLMLKLKLQYMGHLRWRVDSLEKTLMLGKIEGRRRGQWRMNGWMASPTQWTYVWANFGRRWGQRSLACCSSWGCKESDTSEQLNNNTQYDVIDLKFRSNWVSFTFSAILQEEGGQSLDFSPII